MQERKLGELKRALDYALHYAENTVCRSNKRWSREGDAFYYDGEEGDMCASFMLDEDGVSMTVDADGAMLGRKWVYSITFTDGQVMDKDFDSLVIQLLFGVENTARLIDYGRVRERLLEARNGGHSIV